MGWICNLHRRDDVHELLIGKRKEITWKTESQMEGYF